jgi:predicted transcriptional regulator
MDTREEIKKVIDTLPEEALEAVLDYVRFIQEPEEVEPNEADIKAIARGKEEIARGEVVRWRDIKKNVL